MTTYHSPNSAGPGTYLPLAEFKAFWGDRWQLARDEVNRLLGDAIAELAWNTSIAWQSYWIFQFHQAVYGGDGPAHANEYTLAIQHGLAAHPYPHDLSKPPNLNVPNVGLSQHSFIHSSETGNSIPRLTGSALSERPMFFSIPKEQQLNVRIADLRKFQIYTPPAGWQVTLSKVASAAIQTVAVGGVLAGVTAALSSIGSTVLSNAIGADNALAVQEVVSNIGGAIDQVQNAVQQFQGIAGGSAAPGASVGGSADYAPPAGPSGDLVEDTGEPPYLMIGVVGLALLLLIGGDS